MAAMIATIHKKAKKAGTVMIAARITERAFLEFRRQAIEERRTVSNVVRNALEDYLVMTERITPESSA